MLAHSQLFQLTLLRSSYISESHQSHTCELLSPPQYLYYKIFKILLPDLSRFVLPLCQPPISILYSAATLQLSFFQNNFLFPFTSSIFFLPNCSSTFFALNYTSFNLLCTLPYISFVSSSLDAKPSPNCSFISSFHKTMGVPSSPTTLSEPYTFLALSTIAHLTCSHIC